MVSPLTDRWSATPSIAPPQPTAPPELLPADVRRAVTEIAAAPGAWCPALSPEGDRVAYVTDRSGIPRLEVAALEGDAVPAVAVGPHARRSSPSRGPRTAAGWPTWSAPAARSAPSCTSSAPTAATTACVAGEDPRATVFAGGWTGPGHYACSIAPGDGPDADIVLVDVATGAHRTLARGGFLSVTSVSADERFVLARRGPRGYRHIVLIDVESGRAASRPRPRRPGWARLGGRPVRPRRPLGLRAGVPAGRAVRRPRRPRRGPAVRGRRPGGGPRRPVPRRRRPRRLRAAHRRHGARRVDGRRGHRTAGARPRRRRAGPRDRAARAGTARLVAGRRRRDDGRRAHRPARPARAVARPAERRGRAGDAAVGAPVVPTRPCS